MEPRARAGKNVGRMNFNPTELAQFLYAHGDVRQPLPETVRTLDEILTEFIQGVSFEATRVAQYAGRQKVKYEDFEFAMRRNPTFLGKVQDNFEMRRELEATRKILTADELTDLGKEYGEGGAPGGSKRGRKPKNRGLLAGAAGGQAAAGAGSGQQQRQVAGQVDGADEDEELGEADDDAQAEADALGHPRKK
ncbi:hypothetical protein NKR23_g10701 [Pleurostoma richardsiae]|uniref:Transcription initiation factor TFIID subunit 13 n=1 Tax=Pleurostoma richardsiae TaxID=41990 RepID=A0AA38R4V1_9PEZI|nr:hypothetical protein NKR23_g10701 [Pleurostoma richardsiae]